MGAFFGALLGALTIVVIGRSAKGRDFLGLAVAMFFLSLVTCVALSPIFFEAERIAAAQSGASESLDTAGIILAGILAYLIAALPGLVFVSVAKGDGG